MENALAFYYRSNTLHGWAWLTKMATDFMLLSIQKFSASFTRTEAQKIQIPLAGWLFVMGNQRSTHDSGIKRASYYSFKKLVRSPPRVAPRSNIQCSWMQQWQCTAKSWCRPYALRHTVLLHQSHVTSLMRGEWSMIHSVCAVFWPNYDLKSCLADGCIRAASVNNITFHGGHHFLQRIALLVTIRHFVVTNGFKDGNWEVLTLCP
jgi:hypothetical protein